MEYLKVEGHSNLVRDSRTNCIINTNTNEYSEYITRRNAKTEGEQKIQNLEQDVANIRNDLNEIKDLLRNLTYGSK